MVIRIGKKQMVNAITMLGTMPNDSQTMKSGAIATLGIMFRVTISGMKNRSTVSDHENAMARPTPTTTASR